MYETTKTPTQRILKLILGQIVSLKAEIMQAIEGICSVVYIQNRSLKTKTAAIRLRPRPRPSIGWSEMLRIRNHSNCGPRVIVFL